MTNPCVSSTRADARVLLRACPAPRLLSLSIAAMLGGLACAPTLALAQASPALAETVVTATRTPTRADELLSDTVVIDRAQIEQQASRTLPEILARVAGVQISANGGAGKASSVFIRGAEARHTILLIDGVRYGSATLGTPVWENIPVDMIERIEVVKGPASALYGSDGVGGVVQIFTRKGKPGEDAFVGARHLLARCAAHARQGLLLDQSQGALRQLQSRPRSLLAERAQCLAGLPDQSRLEDRRRPAVFGEAG